MARILQRIEKSCPNCGGSNILREKQEITHYQKNAMCQSCGFLILKSNLQISLEAIVTAAIYVLVIFFHYNQETIGQIAVGFLILGLIALFASFSLISKMPDSAALAESNVHVVLRRFLNLSKWIGVIIVAYVFATMK